MSQILIASNNQGKFDEIQALLLGLKVELLTPRMLDLEISVEESGQTYEENAELKGKAYAQATGLMTLADDSGLEVDALNGLPGLRSARFAPMPGASDADRRAYLLQQLKDHPHPWLARFRCVLAMVRAEEFVRFVEGICPGEVISDERGQNGFGYDPIFLIPELGRTMAELSMEEKNRLSHRGRAIQTAIPILVEFLKIVP